MKILFVNHGGPQSNSLNHIRSFARLLTARGHHCAVALPGHDAEDRDNDPGDLPLHAFATVLENPAVFAEEGPPDLLHVWTPREHVRRFLAAFSARHRCPFVLHLEDPEDRLLELASGRPVQELRGLPDAVLELVLAPELAHPRRWPMLLHACAAATCITPALLPVVPAGRPSLLLYPWVDDAFFDPPPPDPSLAARLGLRTGERLLVFTGSTTFATRQDMRQLLEAVVRLNRDGTACRLARTGMHPEIFFQALDPVWQEHVVDLGYLPRERLPALCALADLLIQPGEADAFNRSRLPSKIPEYLATGRPCLLPPIELAPGFQPGTHAFTFATGGTADLAAAISEALADPECAAAIGRAGREYARQRFQDMAVIDALVSLYEAVHQERAFLPPFDSLDQALQFWRSVPADHPRRLPALQDLADCCLDENRALRAALADSPPHPADPPLGARPGQPASHRLALLEAAACREPHPPAAPPFVPDTTAWDRIARRLEQEARNRLQRENDRLRTEYRDSCDTAAATAGRLRQAEDRVARMRASASWRLTTPLRWLRRRLLDPFRKAPPPAPPGAPPPPAANATPGIVYPSFPDNPTEGWLCLNRLTPAARELLLLELEENRARLPRLHLLLPAPPGTDSASLEKTLHSLRSQVHADWTASVVLSAGDSAGSLSGSLSDDARIHFSDRSWSAVLKEHPTDFLVFVQAGDLLREDALAEAALETLHGDPPDLLYTDFLQDKGPGLPPTPVLLPGWSPEQLLCQPWPAVFWMVRPAILPASGPWLQAGTPESAHDLLLRLAESTLRVRHLPLPLVTSAGPAHAPPENHRRIVVEALRRRGLRADAAPSAAARRSGLPLVEPVFPDDGPEVCILIPTRNRADLLRACLDSLRLTTYRNFHVLIADDGSDEPEALALLEATPHRVWRSPDPRTDFNFAVLANRAARETTAEILLLLNNDTEVIHPRWLSQMVGWLGLPGVGAVGARLLYPDGTIQHDGLTLGFGGWWPGSLSKDLNPEAADDPGFQLTSRNVSAVTGACLLVRRQTFIDQGGFDAEAFPVSFNDVDFCLRLARTGERVVLSAGATLRHHEGASRGRGCSAREAAAFRARYPDFKDAFHNPNLSLSHEHFTPATARLLRRPPRPAGVLWLAPDLTDHPLNRRLLRLILDLRDQEGLFPTLHAFRDGALREAAAAEGIDITAGGSPGDRHRGSMLETAARLLEPSRFAVLAAVGSAGPFGLELAARHHRPVVWLHPEGSPPTASPPANRVLFPSRAAVWTGGSHPGPTGLLRLGFPDTNLSLPALGPGRTDAPTLLSAAPAASDLDAFSRLAAALLEALPAWTLRLDCSAPEFSLSHARTIAATLPPALRDRFGLCSDPADRGQALGTAAAFLLPAARPDPAGELEVLRALARGLPAFLSDQSHLREVLPAGWGVHYFPAGDPGAAAKCIAASLGQAETLDRLRSEAAAALAAALPWRETVRQCADCLREAIETGPLID
ncbi:MAG: glycosyltransferase [Puniceicoccaceae bacterium]|nr:MAG: glycosyltransferase [Puniceicoccaceae bacterium]